MSRSAPTRPIAHPFVDASSLNRRQSLQIGLAGAACGLLVSGQTTNPAQASDSPRFNTVPFVDDLPVSVIKTVGTLDPPSTPDVQAGSGECGRNPHQRRGDWPANRFYTLRVKAGEHRFHLDMAKQTVWGFDGIYPGPTFVERYGVPTIVRIYNDLPAQNVGFGSPEITTHLHNLHCASESDGFAADFYSRTKHGPTLTGVGAYQDHHYPHCYAGYDNPAFKDSNGALRGDPREALGTLWYHDHRELFTAANCYRGLMGFYLLFDHIDSGNELDTNTEALRLPSGVGKYDIPLMISDFLFDSSGNLEFDQFETKGILGNKFCINGKIQPKFSVQPRKYRFRLLDASLSRFYELYLTDGAGVNYPFKYIANDGNLLPAPLDTNKVRLAPAERGDIVIDFAKFPMNKPLYLVNRLIQDDGRGPEDAETNVRNASGNLLAKGTQLMRFDIDREADWVTVNGVQTSDPSRVPATLRALPPVTLSEVVKRRSFRFDRENEVWTVNGEIFDYSKPTITVQKGTAEIWQLEGNGNWHHPVHIHMEEFQILTRNGIKPPLHESGRKDVVVLEPGEKVRIFIRFREFTGKYMMHCHNLVHEDHAMMIRFDIV